MTSNHHALYDLGYTRTTMAVNKEIADQHAAVNTFPGLVHTARHTMRAGGTRSR